ncbi:MAG: TlpA family protein disulfide reductase, partial [Pyrinomonadaceae bacterium]
MRILDKTLEKYALQPAFSSANSSLMRTRLHRIIAALCLLVGAIAIINVGLRIRNHTPRQSSIARIDKTLPSLPVVDVTGRVLDVSKIGLGTRTIIIFYSPSCKVCERELPKLQPFPSNLRLVMVNEETEGSTEKFS